MLKQEATPKLQPLFTQEMQLSLHVLQMPVQQLAHWLELQIQQNPLLDYEQEQDDTDPLSQDQMQDQAPELDFDHSGFEVLSDLDESFETSLFLEHGNDDRPGERPRKDQEESPLASTSSLFDHLMQQAKEHFTNTYELYIAEILIGSLNENGLLPPLESLVLAENYEKSKTVLQVIQTFDPAGVAAQSLQESLLLQLNRQGKEKTLAYTLLLDHFEALSHNQLLSLQKKLKRSLQDIQTAIQKDIRPLSLAPASRFSHNPTITLTPDVTIKNDATGWQIEINDEPLPSIRIAEMPKNLSEPDKRMLRPHLFSAKALVRLLEQRHATLLKITTYMLKRQHHFLSGNTSTIAPLTIQDIAHELQLHPSTIHRALSDKILSCAHGLLPLRRFICQPHTKHPHESKSIDTIKKQLLDLIARENKNNPLSDEALATELASQGIRCARRTIAKYRTVMRIPPALYRKKWGL